MFCPSRMRSYLDGLPAYAYELPCGHKFRSFNRSVADDRDGMHWFWCRTCRVYSALRPSEAVSAETPPLHPSGQRMSDTQLTIRITAAIIKDRIAAAYRIHWNTVSIKDLARNLNVSQRHVQAVALDLGVYE